MTLESIEKILEWSPISFVERMAPRPILFLATGGHDIVHPAWAVLDAYERARNPKEIRFLPFGQIELYFEPGLSVSLSNAIEFFRSHLGAKV
jgi:fermentation-respiration switch protein FrsA (DUF1100 family)